jgi:hypothetical protein
MRSCSLRLNVSLDSDYSGRLSAPSRALTRHQHQQAGTRQAASVQLGTFPAASNNDILDAAEFPPAIPVIA